MADGFFNLSPEMLQTADGVSQLNQMLQTLYNNVVGDTENVKQYYGYGTPEGQISAGIGSTYMRLDGSTDTTFYRKESGTANTGWTATVAPPTLPLSVTNGGTGGNFSSTTQGVIPYFSGTGVISGLPVGTAGQFLQTQGAGANPQWASVGIKLTSLTTLSAVTNSGDIAIISGHYYMVNIFISTLSAADSLGLRFNNNTGSNYLYVYRGFDVGATASNGNNSSGASSIQLGPTAVTTSNYGLNYILYIYPQNVRQTMAFKFFGQFNGSNLEGFADGTGLFDANQTSSSFRIISTAGANITGTIALYELTTV